MIRYLCIVEGRVQGVGFRYFAQTLALKYKLTGYAKNLENGMVELQIQGEDSQMQNFLKNLRQGNRFINIENISSKCINVINDENKFNIRY